MFVIGTAGHVDHGKSALVKALTGVDPDRLQEEKLRGMTIDLGFAELLLPSGRHAGVVDVPGHERFIKNMLAGVGGIDFALLVVAADEGVMPQTREHLAILHLLNVSNGVVALTKSDLADDETLELMSLEIAGEIEGTCLSDSPIVTCSARTGAGLDVLLQTIDERLDGGGRAVPAGHAPRLPIDRLFTVAGFGTVVTGTLVGGALRVGDEVEALPALGTKNVRARVRGLQTHGKQVEIALPGTRTAVNLGNVDLTEVARGQILTSPGQIEPARSLEVRLRAIESAPHALRHNTMLTFHHYASESPARLVLLEADELLPGEEAWAQLRLARPVPALAGDRFVLRDAETTLGGGSIVTLSTRGRAGKRLDRKEALERLAGGGDAEALYVAIRRQEPATIPSGAAFEGLDPGRLHDALDALTASGRVVVTGSAEEQVVYTCEGFARFSGMVNEAVEDYHQRYALRPGLPREELRSRLGLAPKTWDALVQCLVTRGTLEQSGPQVHLPGWRPRLSQQTETEAQTYLRALRATPYAPVASLPSQDVLRYLVDSGLVVRLQDGTMFDASAYQRMVEMTVALLERQGDVSLAEVRDLLGTSRRYVQPFLEHLDQLRITARRDDRRVLIRRP
ncbi:MAG: selenocysteine-specific translation elongation factor [Dehalococcoidia bacterium]